MSIWANLSPTERRRGEDRKFYTAREFQDFYGTRGVQKWKQAQPFAEKRMAGGKAYSVQDFRDYYVDELGEQGWATKWYSAPPASVNDEF